MATVYEKMKKICDNIRLRTGRTDLLSLDDIAEAILTIGGEVKPKYTNKVSTSIDTDGSVFNSVGYKDDYRLGSDGTVSSSKQTGSTVIGFVSCAYTDTIRIKGAVWLRDQISTGHFYIHFYDSTKTRLNGFSCANYSNYSNHISITYDESSGITTFKIIDPNATTGLTQSIKTASFFRINAYGKGADLIVTVNEEITD